MNPGLVVKLRPSGPWRIGPDSGARNRVDVIYHSDSLYSAVTAAMARLGWLEEWLDATARTGCARRFAFSSCFPFLDEIGLRGSAAHASGRRRRLRAGGTGAVEERALRSADGGAGDSGGAALGREPVERGRSQRVPGARRKARSVPHGGALERRRGPADGRKRTAFHGVHRIPRRDAGLWTVVSFADEAAREQWQEPVKAAFRLLADSGFGGERSRGWGRSEAPEFIEGMLPDLILPLPTESAAARAGGDRRG